MSDSFFPHWEWETAVPSYSKAETTDRIPKGRWLRNFTLQGSSRLDIPLPLLSRFWFPGPSRFLSATGPILSHILSSAGEHLGWSQGHQLHGIIIFLVVVAASCGNYVIIRRSFAYIHRWSWPLPAWSLVEMLSWETWAGFHPFLRKPAVITLIYQSLACLFCWHIRLAIRHGCI